MLINPTIFQFDSDENYHTVADLICYNMDLEILEHVMTVEHARKITNSIRNKGLQPDIIIVSKLLDNDFNDGEKLAKFFRENSAQTKIIAYTIDKEVEWADYIALKTSKDVDKSLVSVLEQITGKKCKFSNA
ncbi:MAG: hypothetical protein WCJ58_03455 [bacterium]